MGKEERPLEKRHKVGRRQFYRYIVGDCRCLIADPVATLRGIEQKRDRLFGGGLSFVILLM